MKKILLIVIFLFATLFSGNFVIAQGQILNKSVLPNDIVKQKIAFIDSVRKTDNSKQQQDNFYYKSLLEQGFSSEHVDSLRKVANPELNLHSSKEEIGLQPLQKHDNQNAQKNNNSDPNPVPFVTGVEQNCMNGIIVCAQSYTQTTSYTGHGTVQEVNGTCLLGKETNSVWYIFTVQTPGNFGFTINTAKDYDYALYNISPTGAPYNGIGGCNNIPTSLPVRCNFSALFGLTGMSPAGVNPSEPSTGPKWSTELAVTAGQTYALIVDNWSADATGYTLSFTTGGGYASIYDNIAPTISGINYNCDKTLTLTMSEQILCSSIHADDFTITGPSGMTVTAASGVGCSTSNITTQVALTLSGATTAGVYTLHVNQGGTDLNTLLDKCTNALATGATITFQYVAPVFLVATPNTICISGTAVTLTATGAPASTVNIYSLMPGSLTASSNGSGTGTFSVNPFSSMTYNLSVTYGGCTQTAHADVDLLSGIVVTINPINPSVCSGTASLTASSTVGGLPCSSCTYLWSNAATTPTINVGAGTYNVTASLAGCSSSSASSTVTTATAGASSICNVYYVSPTGGGTGLTKTSPIDLLSAISLSSCQNAFIKMQVGLYNFSDSINIGSYLTIEGGYNVGFTTKTSDMTGTGNTTRIVKDASHNGSGYNVVGFKITDGATGFRLQDLRIELPDEAIGTQLTNYGIKLGAGCTSYNIVRCYIDAGTGAN